MGTLFTSTHMFQPWSIDYKRKIIFKKVLTNTKSFAIILRRNRHGVIAKW